MKKMFLKDYLSVYRASVKQIELLILQVCCTFDVFIVIMKAFEDSSYQD